MNPRDRKRLEVVHGLLSSVRSREFREATAEMTDGGEHVVMSALPDDTMAGLFKRVRAINGPLHVAVRADGGFELFVMEPCTRPRHAYAPSGEQDDCLVSPDTHVGMVLEYLHVRGAPIFCHEALPSVALKLVDEGLVGNTLH